MRGKRGTRLLQKKEKSQMSNEKSIFGDLPVFDNHYFTRKNAAASLQSQAKSSEQRELETRGGRLVEGAGGSTSETGGIGVSDSDVGGSGGSMGDGKIKADGSFRWKYTCTNFNKVMELYHRLLSGKEIDPDLVKQMIFYGGTVPYAILEKEPEGYMEKHFYDVRERQFDTDETERNFNDIDIYAPLKLMKEIRKAITTMKGFEMHGDSADLQIMPKKTMEEINPLHRAFYNKLIHKDFGFFGEIAVNSESSWRKMNISLYPLFEENDGIQTRGFRTGGWEDCSKFLIDATVAKDMTMNEFVTPAKILGRDVKIVPMEYTVASKQKAIEKHWIKRLGKDIFDIAFIMAHGGELGVDSERLKRFEAAVPNMSVKRAYEMENGEMIRELDAQQYQDRVFTKIAELGPERYY